MAVTFTPTGGSPSSGSSSGATLIEVQTASGDASIDFTTLSSDYEYFEFVFSGVAPATDNQGMELLTSTDGGSSYDASAFNYQFHVSYAKLNSSPSLSQIGNASAAACVFVYPGVGNATNEDFSGVLRMYKPSATNYTQFTGQFIACKSTGEREYVRSAGVRVSAADVDAIRFRFGSGNIASGSIACYGYSAS